MNRGCEQMQEAIVEAGGRLETLPEGTRRHVGICPSCAALAERERDLGALLERMVPPEDRELEAQILAAVAERRMFRRLKAFVPVAASFLVALAGVALLGGVPGSSLLTRVPAWSLQSWLGLLGQLGDWGVALVAVARAGGALVPGSALAAAAAVALGGFGGLTAVAVRWRRNPPW